MQDAAKNPSKLVPHTKEISDEKSYLLMYYYRPFLALVIRNIGYINKVRLEVV
jgi:hypothetical protein